MIRRFEEMDKSMRMPEQTPTVWGLRPEQLHDRYWASRGVQVVRCGEQISLSSDAKLFLLTDDRSLFVFSLAPISDTLSWLKPSLMFIRLHDTVEHGYREQVLADEEGRFLSFKRQYQDADIRLNRLCLTPRREVAEAWQQAGGLREGWRQLRLSVPRKKRAAVSLEGEVYRGDDENEMMLYLRSLVQVWRRPDATIPRARQVLDGVWADGEAMPTADTRFIGKVWVGCGRKLGGVRSVVGPAILWDDVTARPSIDPTRFNQIMPIEPVNRLIQLKKLSSLQKAGKRGFDIVFASIALLITLPMYPIVSALIMMEDGWPFFFVHRRETMGGREFPCLKFRTMRKDAEQIKATFQTQNVSDGPHFFIQDDPRLLRCGKLLRKLNIDELPQFFNVLVGHMSIVGPRPSPHKENQFCPPWREARLSVRPGITGLWQVKRSRREGLDFQEWIQYDIEYVENLSWRLDMKIIGLTVRQILEKVLK